MNMARSGSVSSVNSSLGHENTPRADLKGSPLRQQSAHTQQQVRSNVAGVNNYLIPYTILIECCRELQSAIM